MVTNPILVENLHKALIKNNGAIMPCFNRDWEHSTDSEDGIFWYNDIKGSTHIINPNKKA